MSIGVWKRFRHASYKPGTAEFYTVTALGLILVYAVVLTGTTDGNAAQLVADTLANVLPLLLLAAITRFLAIRYLFPLPSWIQVWGHAVAGFIFAAVWFFLVMVFLGFVSGEAFLRFSVRPFFGAAALWQMMQGFTFYAVVALLAYVEQSVGTDVQESSETLTQAPLPRPTQVLVRDGDEVRPLDTKRIVLVKAAGDYAEVVTFSAKHMLRTPLTELAESLGPAFLRVHRSTIVNIDYVERIEPAGGGRMTLHLGNGSTVNASRAGAKIIRERAI